MKQPIRYSILKSKHSNDSIFASVAVNEVGYDSSLDVNKIPEISHNFQETLKNFMSLNLADRNYWPFIPLEMERIFAFVPVNDSGDEVQIITMHGLILSPHPVTKIVYRSILDSKSSGQKSFIWRIERENGCLRLRNLETDGYLAKAPGTPYVCTEWPKTEHTEWQEEIIRTIDLPSIREELSACAQYEEDKSTKLKSKVLSETEFENIFGRNRLSSIAIVPFTIVEHEIYLNGIVPSHYQLFKNPYYLVKKCCRFSKLYVQANSTSSEQQDKVTISWSSTQEKFKKFAVNFHVETTGGLSVSKGPITGSRDLTIGAGFAHEWSERFEITTGDSREYTYNRAADSRVLYYQLKEDVQVSPVDGNVFSSVERGYENINSLELK